MFSCGLEGHFRGDNKCPARDKACIENMVRLDISRLDVLKLKNVLEEADFLLVVVQLTQEEIEKDFVVELVVEEKQIKSLKDVIMNSLLVQFSKVPIMHSQLNNTQVKLNRTVD